MPRIEFNLVPFPKPTISFCTVVSDRLGCLRESWEANAEVLRGLDAEWVVLEYRDTPGLAAFLRESVAPRVPHLVHARVIGGGVEGHPFPIAHAKNCAHLAARGAVLVNLDADNVAGDFERVAARMGEFDLLVPKDRLEQREGFKGTGGRIAIGRSAFHALCGYDEEMRGYGWDDTDLIQRALKSELVSYNEVDVPVGCYQNTQSVRERCWPTQLEDLERNEKYANSEKPIVSNNGMFRGCTLENSN